MSAEAIRRGYGAAGEMLVRHPYFNQPVFVCFPRPAVMRGQDGLECYKPEPDKSLVDAVWENLRRLDPNLSRNAVADIIARAQNSNGEPNRDRVIAAMQKALTLRPTGDEVLKLFDRVQGSEHLLETTAAAQITKKGCAGNKGRLPPA